MLNYSVELSIEKMKEHYTYGSFDNSYLSDELISWMVENVELGSWNWDVTKIWPDGIHKLVFRSKNEEDAIAFKLRWT